MSEPIETWPGRAYPLGAAYDGAGTNFSLFSLVAEDIELCLFDDGAEERVPLEEIDASSLAGLAQIEEKLALAVCARFALDTSSVALDMTNFATFIDTANGKAPIAQRGKARQKRSDLRLVGLGLVVTRAGGIPLLSHAYPGSKPDVTQFPEMIETLAARHAGLAVAAGGSADTGTDMTVVFDAGQNSEANFALLAGTNLHYVGSVPASDCRDL